MDPVEAWIDAEEVKRLAESLTTSSDSAQLLTVESAEAAYGDAFVGFDAHKASLVQVIEPAVEEKPAPPAEKETPAEKESLADPIAEEKPEESAQIAEPITMGAVTSESPTPESQEEPLEKASEPEPEALSPQDIEDQEKVTAPPAVSAALAAAASSAIMGPLVSSESATEAVSLEVALPEEDPNSSKDTSHLADKPPRDPSAVANEPAKKKTEASAQSDDLAKTEVKTTAEIVEWLEEEEDAPPQPYPFKTATPEKLTDNQLNPSTKIEPAPATSEEPETKPFDTPTKTVSTFPASESPSDLVVEESPFKEVATSAKSPENLLMGTIANATLDSEGAPPEEKESFDDEWASDEDDELEFSEKPEKEKKVPTPFRERSKTVNQSNPRKRPLVNPFDPDGVKAIAKAPEEARTPAQSAPVTESTPSKEEVHKLVEPTDKVNKPHEDKLAPASEKIEPVQPQKETPPQKPQPAQVSSSPEPTGVAPFLTRLEEFGEWLKNETPTQKFFILDRDGKILIDEVESLNLQKISRTLANHTIAVQRRGGKKASPSAHLKIGENSFLEVIPTKSKYGNLILACIVPESMTPKGAEAVAHNLLVTANQGA